MRDKFDEIAERLVLDLSDGMIDPRSSFSSTMHSGRSALLRHNGQWISLHEPEGVTALADRLREEFTNIKAE